MSSKEQAQQIIKAMKEDLKKRKKMSQEERRKTAVTQLQSIGVLDAKGQIVNGYEGVFTYAE